MLISQLLYQKVERSVTRSKNQTIRKTLPEILFTLREGLQSVTAVPRIVEYNHRVRRLIVHTHYSFD